MVREFTRSWHGSGRVLPVLSYIHICTLPHDRFLSNCYKIINIFFSQNFSQNRYFWANLYFFSQFEKMAIGGVNPGGWPPLSYSIEIIFTQTVVLAMIRYNILITRQLISATKAFILPFNFVAFEILKIFHFLKWAARTVGNLFYFRKYSYQIYIEQEFWLKQYLSPYLSQ